jgi:hypothetical protein
MGGGNVDTWHDRMYVHCNLLQHSCCFSGTFITILKWLPHVTTMQML